MDQKKSKCITGFGVRKTFIGKSNFDKYYVSKKFKKVAVKTGPGEEDFKIVNKIVETKTDIRESIQADAENSGINSYLKDFAKTGQSLPSVSVSNDIQDFTGMPTNLAEAAELGDKADALYKKLDPRLTKGQTAAEFLKNLTSEQFVDYLRQVYPKKDTNIKKDDAVKVDNKKEGDK